MGIPEFFGVISGFLDKSWKHVLSFSFAAASYQLAINRGMQPAYSVAFAGITYVLVLGICNLIHHGFQIQRAKRKKLASKLQEAEDQMARAEAEKSGQQKKWTEFIKNVSSLPAGEKNVLREFIKQKRVSINLDAGPDAALIAQRLKAAHVLKSAVSYSSSFTYYNFEISASMLVLLTDNQEALGLSECPPA